MVDRVSDHLEDGLDTLLSVIDRFLPEASLVASVSTEAEAARLPQALRIQPLEAPLQRAAE